MHVSEWDEMWVPASKRDCEMLCQRRVFGARTAGLSFWRLHIRALRYLILGKHGSSSRLLLLDCITAALQFPRLVATCFAYSF